MRGEKMSCDTGPSFITPLVATPASPVVTIKDDVNEEQNDATTRGRQ